WSTSLAPRVNEGQDGLPLAAPDADVAPFVKAGVSVGLLDRLHHPLQYRGATGGGDEGGHVQLNGILECDDGLADLFVPLIRLCIAAGVGDITLCGDSDGSQPLQPRQIRLGQSRAHRAALREFGRSEARSIPNAAASKSACISVHFSACPLSRSPP